MIKITYSEDTCYQLVSTVKWYESISVQ